MAIPEIPDPAIAELRAGRKVDAIRLVREKTGLGLKESKELVDAVLARDPSLRAANPDILTMVGDYLASSWKLPFAAGLGAGAFALWFVGEVAPKSFREQDPGLVILAVLGIPLVATAVALVVWQRRWRARRAAALAAPVAPAAPPARPKFSGLPDPGAAPAPRIAQDLPASALAALDRDDPIAAIKAIRAERGLGLAEAKALVDAVLVARRR